MIMPTRPTPDDHPPPRAPYPGKEVSVAVDSPSVQNVADGVGRMVLWAWAPTLADGVI
ncbi:hypothetical protein PISMIDRAFT_671126 [Pisolithus microcarpus 441]|uniref:Uncharacterized protein n=1 Tax=Pisolithus microcarpus 441 TaxID=765257 RepID=A0A0D0A6P6_9AGAM|nr:hypothetical protein PISMIDRAFT_671126 [Pisolithus microcarpus 441]